MWGGGWGNISPLGNVPRPALFRAQSRRTEAAASRAAGPGLSRARAVRPYLLSAWKMKEKPSSSRSESPLF